MEKSKGLTSSFSSSLSPSSISDSWRSSNDSFSSSSSSSSDETVIFKGTKVPSKTTKSLPCQVNELNLSRSGPLDERFSYMKQEEVNGNSTVDMADNYNFKEQLDKDDEQLFLVPYEPLGNRDETQELPLDKKMENSLNETMKVKKKMIKMFDFLEDVGDKVLGKNMEKIIKQKERFSAMCDTWESTSQYFLLRCAESEQLKFLSSTMEAMSSKGYVEQLGEERLYYRGEVSKLYRKYLLAMSELHRLRKTLMKNEKCVTMTVAKLDNHEHNPCTTDVVSPTSSTDVVCEFDYESTSPDYNLLQIKSYYEAQLVSSDKVHKSLEEQNRLLYSQMKLLKDENEILINRCKLLEKNGLSFNEHGNIMQEIDVGSTEQCHSGGNRWLLADEDIDCKSQVFYKSTIEGDRNTMEYQYQACILQKKFGGEKRGELEKQIADLQFEVEKSKDLAELHRNKAEEAYSVITALKASHEKLQNELQRANETVNVLRTELKGVKEANKKFSEYKTTAQEIIAAHRKLENTLHQQRVTTDRLLLMSKEFKEKDKYQFVKTDP